MNWSNMCPHGLQFLSDSLLLCGLLSMGHMLLHGLSMGCTGTSAHGAPPPHPSSLTSVSAGLFLSHFYHSSLCHSCCKAFFNPFLNTTELSPAALIGSALANCGSGLEPVGSVCIRHEDSLWCHRSHPCNPQLLQPTPCHRNPIHRLRG